MKVKCDFVTNSSSTSYIAVFPKDFDANIYRDVLLEILEDNGRDSDDERMDSLIEEANASINVDGRYGVYDNYNVFAFLVEIAIKNGYIVTEMDGSPDSDSIVNIRHQKERILKLLEE